MAAFELSSSVATVVGGPQFDANWGYSFPSALCLGCLWLFSSVVVGGPQFEANCGYSFPSVFCFGCLWLFSSVVVVVAGGDPHTVWQIGAPSPSSQMPMWHFPELRISPLLV